MIFAFFFIVSRWPFLGAFGVINTKGSSSKNNNDVVELYWVKYIFHLQ